MARDRRETTTLIQGLVFSVLMFGSIARAAEPKAANIAASGTAPELIQTYMAGKDAGFPATFSMGRGFQFIGDYLYVSTRAGGGIQYFKRDPQTGTLTYVDSVAHSTLKASFSLSAAGGRLYGLGLFVWGVTDGDKHKVLSWFDIDPNTGKPIEKGTIEVTAASWGEQLLVGPDEKDLYAFLWTPEGNKFMRYKLGADGKPEKAAEITGGGLSASACLSPDGKNIYTAGDHAIAIVERQATGAIAYKKALSLNCIVELKPPEVIEAGDLQASVSGISPDGKWLYISLGSRIARTKNYFGIFKRDPATGELTYSEGGSDADPRYSSLASLGGMNLVFGPDGKSGFITNGRCLVQQFQLEAATGRIKILNDVVLGKPGEIKCRPYGCLEADFKKGFLYGAGVWQHDSYGGCSRGLWSAKFNPAAAPSGTERADLQTPLVAAANTKAAGEDWPTKLGVNGDGKSSLKNIRKDWSGGLKKVWEVTGLSPGDSTWSTPAVLGNKLIVMGTHGFIDEVFCFDADKGGRPLWITDLSGAGDISQYGGRDGWCGGPVTMPCISGDKVYVTQSGKFNCLSMTDGKVLWSKTVVTPCHTYAATPLVCDNLLIVPGTFQADGKKAFLLAAFNKDTGDTVWTYDGVGNFSGGDSPTFGHVSPLRMKINGVDQIVYNTGALACGLNIKTGKPIWEYPFEAKGSNVNASEPVSDGSTVAIMLGDGAASPFGLQVEGASVKPLWSKIPNFRAYWSDAILKDGFMYTFSSDGLYSAGNSDFRCVDLKTGQPKWVQPKTGCGTTLEVDGHLICLTYSGDLWLVNPSPEGFKKVTEWKGAVKQEPWWTHDGGKTPAPCWTTPIIAHGKLYIRYSDTLTCYDLLN